MYRVLSDRALSTAQVSHGYVEVPPAEKNPARATKQKNKNKQNITVVWSQAPSIPWILRAFSILHYLLHPQKVEDSPDIHF